MKKKSPKHISTIGLFSLLIGLNYSILRADWQTVTPTSVGCFDSGECFVSVTPNLTVPNTCVKDRTQFRFKTTSAGADAMYKTALAAFLAGKRININAYTGLCISGYMQAWYLHIIN